MNKARLLKLADLLDADAKNRTGVKFNLTGWGYGPMEEGKIHVNCGTQACAVGLACISGAFKRSGLGYEIGTNSSIVPIFDGRSHFDAVQAFFAIDNGAAAYLFLDRNYTTHIGAKAERMVAKRIRKFVAAN